MFYGSSENGTEQMTFCGVEDFWGNILWFLDGILLADGGEILISDQSSFNNSGTGYSNFGKMSEVGVTGYMSDADFRNETGFTPNEVKGSMSTYYGVTTTIIINTAGKILTRLVGQSYSNGTPSPFGALFQVAPTDYYPSAGGRLMYI